MALIEVRLRPSTPWRVGHGGGDRERVDLVYHSDALYSAITHAMKTLGWLGDWLAATVGPATVRNDAAQPSGPAVCFSSLFPFVGKTRLIAPPKTWWPPANPGRLYTDAAKLIPLEVVRYGIVDESRWMVDGETGCMIHTGSAAPVQIAVRTAAAVDRFTGVADPHRIACLEFAPNAGWWGVFRVDDAVWEARVKSAFRLLADSGFGGERSRGWGRAAAPEFSDASSLLPTRATCASDEGAWWLLSLYSPHASDAVDWSRGEYGATQRGGWIDSQAGAAPKKQVRLLEEGSVVFAPKLRGRAVDVAPDGFPHPVYRAGFAFAVPVPAEPLMRQPQVATPEPPAPAEASETAEQEAAEEMESEGAPPDPPAAEDLPGSESSQADAAPEAAEQSAAEQEAAEEMESEGAPPDPPPPDPLPPDPPAPDPATEEQS